MKKSFYIFCTLLYTTSSIADNKSITTGTVLFGASVALTVASQKFKQTQTIDESQKLAEKIIDQNSSELRRNYLRSSLQNKKHAKADDKPLLPSQRKKTTHKTINCTKTTDDIDFKIRNNEKQFNIEPILFVPFFPEEHKEITLIEIIDQYYRENNISKVLEISSQHITKFSDDKKENKKFFLNQNDRFKNGRTSIKHIISLKNIITKKVIILASLHGTWSDSESFGANETNTLSKAYLAYAQQLAIKNDAIIYFNVIQWDGNIPQACRKDAGANLAEELKKELDNIKISHPDADIYIKCIGHSHGCNVISFAAKTLKEQNININKAIFFGCPGSDVKPDNIDTVLNIIGEDDFTGTAGTILSSGYKSLSMFKEDPNVKNITLTHEGNNLNHSNIKYIVMNNLPLIEECADQNFQNEQYLRFDIFNQKNLINTIEDDDLITHEIAQNSIPEYVVNSFIDGSKSDKALTEENNDFDKSQKNEMYFKEKYKKSPYKEVTLLEKFTHEMTINRLVSLIWPK